MSCSQIGPPTESARACDGNLVAQTHLLRQTTTASHEVASEIREVVSQDAAQPAEQLLHRFAVKVGKIPSRLDEGFLNRVRGIELGSQPCGQLLTSDGQKISSANLEQTPQSLRRSCSRFLQ
jgi:hypothetical protein